MGAGRKGARRRATAVAAGACAALALALGGAATGEDAPGAPAQSPLLGVVLQRSLDETDGRLLDEGGIRSVRFWLSWADVERQRDDYDWGAADAVVRELAAHGLTPFPFLFGSPEWVGGQDGYDCDPGCIRFGPSSPDTREAFARFAAAAARRYGPGGTYWREHPAVREQPIRAWQIWNEPNLSSFWGPYPNAHIFGELVKAAAARIRAEDPDAEIVLGGLTGDRTNSRRQSTIGFLRDLYEVPEIATAFEGVALHPYNRKPSGVFSMIKRARAVVGARDPDFDLWISEIGWASRGNDRKWSLVTSPGGQARRLKRVFTRLGRRAADWRLRGAYWFAWRDTERGQAVCGWCGAAGLIGRDGVGKPAYEELRRLAQLP